MRVWFSKLRDVFRDRPWGTALMFLLVGYLGTLLFDAWLSDDAYITFRVVDNVIHGFGPVYNVGERVQAYTNPLMMLLLSAFSAITREVYFTSLAISIAASFTAVFVLALKVARSRVTAVAALLVLVFSTSFVSYSTSGLENCLIFLLSALFFCSFFAAEKHSARSLLILTALFSLSLVNRMDTALLLAPALAFAYLHNDDVAWPKMLGVLVTGMLPFVAWEVFAIAYYGFPFPNTAYAKLSTGIPRAEYLIRGLTYYKMSFWQDPLVVTGILAGGAAVLWSRQARVIVPLIGVALYLAYVINIGGDFMRGRMFTAPLFVTMLLVVAITTEEWTARRVEPRTLVMGALGLLLVANLGGLFYEGMSWNSYNPLGVLDDKRIYYQSTNLPLNLRLGVLEKSERVQAGLAYKAAGESPIVYPGIGLRGYYAGPSVHVVDPLALADALLARLPALNNPEWRIGHVWRYVPEGYLETVRTGVNVIEDRDLATYYDKLSLVIKGPLWTRQRWAEIIALNRGAYDHLIDTEHYRYEVEEQYDPNSF